MTKKPLKETSDLFKAVEFCTLASNSSPDIAYTEYCCLSSETGTVYMSDGIVSCGCLCSVQITANPHTNKLASALKKMQTGHSLTILDDSHISIKSGRLKAVIPTIEYVADKLYPDQVKHTIDIENFLWALNTASIVTKDKADRVIHASVIAHEGSCYGTDNILLIECWHGLQLQQDLVIPKTFISALNKIKKKPTGLGYTDKSVTIWYEDNSWIKTQLYGVDWPINNIKSLLRLPTNYIQMPKDLLEATDSLLPFLEKDQSIILSSDKIYVESKNSIHSSYDIELNMNDIKINCKLINLVCKHATGWDYTSQGDRYIMFTGNRLRGLLCLMV